MPRHCNVYSWNYPGEPYTNTVSFPSEEADPEIRRKWIAALPNDPASLPKQIWAYATNL